MAAPKPPIKVIVSGHIKVTTKDTKVVIERKD